MPRSGAEARDRLERAALELYTEHGYDQTTTAAIAARAGVTERTFFRHFADKREVLFNVEGRQQHALASALAAVPADLPPLEAVLRAFLSLVPGLEENRRLAETRHRVIAATPALRERELAKEAALSTVIAGALRTRGLPDWRAALLAHITTAALGHAIHTWMNDPSSDIAKLILQAFTDLQELSQGDLASASRAPRAPRRGPADP